MRFAPGETVGPYRIADTLGAGGMGEVYKAHDSRLDRIVAIKISQQRFSDRFEREARAIAALNHPNICTLYDVGPDYLVMEYVEGHALSGPLTFEKMLEYAGQICDALDAAHRKGIVHRDLKPSNILVTRRGIKLLDFGVARMMGADQTSTLNASVAGTPAYMAPEQWQGKPADARSDIFSLGCVICEMVTGERTLARSIEPPSLDRVVRTCQNADPEERWQSAREVKLALELVQRRRKASPVAARWWLIAFGLALGLLGWSLWRMIGQPAADMRSFRLSLNPPPGTRFTEFGVAIAPDGKRTAFVAGARQSIWVQEFDSISAREIPAAVGASYPFWSPDGAFLAFFAAGKLKTIGASGEGAQVLADAPSGRGGAWNSDGTIIYSPSFNAGLIRVSASGGRPRILTRPDAARQENSHRWPQFLPDGRRFLYYVQSDDPDVSGIYVSSLENTSKSSRLMDVKARAEYAPGVRAGTGSLFYTRNQTLMAQSVNVDRLELQGEPEPIAGPTGTAAIGYGSFSVSPNGVLVHGPASLDERRIEWRDRRGQLIGSERPTGVYNTPRLSPDGRRLVLSRSDSEGNNDVFTYEPGRSNFTRLTFGSLYDGFPVWSPDARHIAFAAGRGGVLNLFLREIGGAGQEQRLTKSPNGQCIDDWSRDGRYILYTESNESTLGDLWTLAFDKERALQAGVQPQRFLGTAFNETHGQFSPDGQWIAYTSNESGREEVYIQHFPPTGEKLLASGEGGDYPRWRGDGRELFYISSDGRLMAVGVKPEANRLVLSRPAELFRVAARLGQIWYDYDVTSDGQRFLVLSPTDELAPRSFTVVTNWPSVRRLKPLRRQ